MEISGIPRKYATITPYRRHDVTNIPMPTHLCSSVLQRSVQTTIILYLAAYIIKIVEAVVSWRKPISRNQKFTGLANENKYEK